MCACNRIYINHNINCSEHIHTNRDYRSISKSLQENIRCSNQKVFDFIPVVEEVEIVPSGVVVVVVSGVVVLAFVICVKMGTGVVV